MKYLSTLLAAIACLCVVACSSPQAGELLSQAEEAIERGDSTQARICCQLLSDTTQMQLTPSQLCRQALVYARVAELCDNSDDMANAILCFDRAVVANRDSVAAFTDQVSLEDRARLRMMRYVNSAMGESFDIDVLVFEDDSINVEPSASIGYED